MWINGYENSDFIAAPDAPLVRKFPLSLWRCDADVDGGLPYIPLFPDVVRLHVNPVKQRPYISIFAKDTDKLDFAGNGLAILTPTACEVHDTINGMRDVQITLPTDSEGRHSLLRINSILKVCNQLYTVKTVDTQFSGNSGSVSAYAECMFYQMADGWVFPVTYLYGATGQHAIDSILAHTDYQARDGAHIYAFQGSSDIVPEKPFRREVDAGCTPVDALLGSGGLIEKLGGELYRDNFYFSINSRMENSNDLAFDIRVGKNLRGIKRTVDTTTMATYFRAYDAFGGWAAYAWDFEAFFGDLFPHYIVRSANFPAPQNADAPDFDYMDYFENVFIPEAMAYFRANCKPIIGYEIDLIDVRNNPDFTMISSETLRVGDKGTLYDERLGGALTIELTETTYDAVADKITRINVGDKQSFVRTTSPLLTVDLTPEPIGGEIAVTDADGVFCYDADGVQIVEEVTV